MGKRFWEKANEKMGGYCCARYAQQILIKVNTLKIALYNRTDSSLAIPTYSIWEIDTIYMPKHTKKQVPTDVFSLFIAQWGAVFCKLT